VVQVDRALRGQAGARRRSSVRALGLGWRLAQACKWARARATGGAGGSARRQAERARGALEARLAAPARPGGVRSGACSGAALAGAGT
jgi:hypothetical protein